MASFFDSIAPNELIRQGAGEIGGGLSTIGQGMMKNQAIEREQSQLNAPLPGPVQDMLNKMSIDFDTTPEAITQALGSGASDADIAQFMFERKSKKPTTFTQRDIPAANMMLNNQKMQTNQETALAGQASRESIANENRALKKDLGTQRILLNKEKLAADIANKRAVIQQRYADMKRKKEEAEAKIEVALKNVGARHRSIAAAEDFNRLRAIGSRLDVTKMEYENLDQQLQRTLSHRDYADNPEMHKQAEAQTAALQVKGQELEAAANEISQFGNVQKQIVTKGNEPTQPPTQTKPAMPKPAPSAAPKKAPQFEEGKTYTVMNKKTGKPVTIRIVNGKPQEVK